MLARGNAESGHVMSLEGGVLALSATFTLPVAVSEAEEKVRA